MTYDNHLVVGTGRGRTHNGAVTIARLRANEQAARDGYQRASGVQYMECADNAWGDKLPHMRRER